MEDNKKRATAIFFALLVFITVLFVATRMYRLDIVPFGAHIVHIDELGAAYDAICIADYGVDQFQLRMPVYFKCFGESQDALYTYLAAIAFKLGGVSIFTYRLPAVICAVAAFAALFFLIRDLLDKWYALAALALMTIMPVFMMSEHWGLQCFLQISTTIIAFCFQVKAVKEDRSLYWFLAGTFWGITLYTYVMAYVIVPIFLLLTMVVLLKFRKLSLKNAVLAVIPLMILGVPLLIQQLVMMDYLQPFSFFGLIDFWPPHHTRYHLMSAEYVVENLLMSFKYTYVADRSAYDANPVFGTMYYVSIPFILIGMVTSAVAVIKDLKAKILNPWIFNWMYFLVCRAFFLFVQYPNVNRINGIYPAYLLFAVYGIKAVVSRINKMTVRVVFLVVVCVAYGISFVLFSKYFYKHDGLQTHAFAEGDGLAVDVEAGEAAALAKTIANGKPVVAMVNDGYYRHMAFALYTETSPYEYFRDHEPRDRYYNGVDWHMPDGLDLSGDTVYLIDAELLHITQYLQTEGFAVDITYPDFTVVYKDV